MNYNNPNNNWMQTGHDPYKGMTEEDRIKVGCLHVAAIISTAMVAMLLCALLGSCTTTKYVPVYHHTTDTLRITQHQRDSLYFCDSIYTIVRTDGDTVYQQTDRWRIRYVERTRTDTLHQSRTDSIPVPYEVTKEVPARLTWWQQARIHLANIMLYLLAIVAIIYVGKKHLRKVNPMP